MSDNINLSNVVIGRVKGEGIIKVDLRLLWDDRQAQTVDHETVDGHWSFGVSGTAWKRVDSSDCHSCGQIIDIVSQVRTPVARRLTKLWRTWHLNDLTAGCSHSEPVYADDQWGRSVPSLDLTPPCPVTGYRYGHAWLVKVIPADVLAEIREVAFMLKEGIEDHV